MPAKTLINPNSMHHVECVCRMLDKGNWPLGASNRKRPRQKPGFGGEVPEDGPDVPPHHGSAGKACLQDNVGTWNSTCCTNTHGNDPQKCSLKLATDTRWGNNGLMRGSHRTAAEADVQGVPQGTTSHCWLGARQARRAAAVVRAAELRSG